MSNKELSTACRDLRLAMARALCTVTTGRSKVASTFTSPEGSTKGFQVLHPHRKKETKRKMEKVLLEKEFATKEKKSR